MAYPLITEYNLSQGMDIPFTYVNDISNGLFIKLLLFAVWWIFVFGSYFIQKRAVGTGDFPQSLAVGGFVTTVLAIILKLIPNWVSGWTLAICIFVAVISIIIFLFSRD